MNISKKLCIILGASAILSIGTASSAQASGSDKVFVCKYVGTPGIDERLQTGQNPINVSVNAIPVSPVVIGSEFADKHGRSVVIAFGKGQPEPSVSACPAPAGPAPVIPVPPVIHPPLIEVIPPAPQPVDKCGTADDGVLIPPATAGYSYVKLVDGFYGGDLTEGFNAYTGKIIVSVNEGHLIPAGNQTVWSFEFSLEPCVAVGQPPVPPVPSVPPAPSPSSEVPQPVAQQVTAAAVVDCKGTVESGFVVFQYPAPVSVIMDIEQANGQKGGLVVESIEIESGSVRYDFEPAVINAINAARFANPNLPDLTVYLTTLKGGGGTYHKVGLLLSNEPCVAVGQPPVTSIPTASVTPAPAVPTATAVRSLPETGAKLIFFCLGIGSTLIGCGSILLRKSRPALS